MRKLNLEIWFEKTSWDLIINIFVISYFAMHAYFHMIYIFWYHACFFKFICIRKTPSKIWNRQYMQWYSKIIHTCIDCGGVCLIHMVVSTNINSFVVFDASIDGFGNLKHLCDVWCYQNLFLVYILFSNEMYTKNFKFQI